MAHLAIIDSNRLGLRLLDVAKDAGHTVSFIRTEKNIHYVETVETVATIARVDHVVILSDTTDQAQLRPALTKIHKKNPVDAVISVLEYTIDVAAAIAAELGIPATSARATALARNKFEMRSMLAASGIPCGRSVRVEGLNAIPDGIDEIGYPVMVKPDRATSSYLSQAILAPEHQVVALQLLRDEWDTLDPQIKEWLPDVFVCETFFKGPLISVEVIASTAGIHVLLVNERILPNHDPTIELGTIMPSTLSAQDKAACAEYAHQVIETAGFDRGIFHVELIMTTDGPRLVEVNPRLMGGSMPYLHDFLTGRNIYKMLIDVHLGKSIVPVPPPPDKHIFSLRIQVLAGGKVVDIPVLEDLPLQGLRVHRYEMSTQAGDIVVDEMILGRFYIETMDGGELRDRAEALLLRCQDILGVKLMM